MVTLTISSIEASVHSLLFDLLHFCKGNKNKAISERRNNVCPVVLSLMIPLWDHKGPISLYLYVLALAGQRHRLLLEGIGVVNLAWYHQKETLICVCTFPVLLEVSSGDLISVVQVSQSHSNTQTHTHSPTSQTEGRTAGRWASCPPRRRSVRLSAPRSCSQRRPWSPWTPARARPAAGRRPGRGRSAPRCECPPGAAGRGGGRPGPGRPAAGADSRWTRPGRTWSSSPTGPGRRRRGSGSRRWRGTRRPRCLPCSPGIGRCCPNGRWPLLCCCSSHRRAEQRTSCPAESSCLCSCSKLSPKPSCSLLRGTKE